MPKTKDALLWTLLPFSIGIPTALSQQYFKDMSQDVINVDNPGETLKHPNKRFFKIRSFLINRNDFTLFKERHARRRSLKVNNYYIAPLYSDEGHQATNVAYGIKFSTSLNNGLFFKDQQPKKIWEFNIKSASEFTFYDLDSVIYFERQIDSEDAYNFANAWRQNKLFDNTQTPIILVPSKEPFCKLLKRGKGMMAYSLLISLTITLTLLYILDYYKK